MTFEDYLRKTLLEKRWSDHWLRCQVDDDGHMSFYVHPDKVDGDTPIFKVVGNNLITKHPVEKS